MNNDNLKGAAHADGEISEKELADVSGGQALVAPQFDPKVSKTCQNTHEAGVSGEDMIKNKHI